MNEEKRRSQMSDEVKERVTKNFVFLSQEIMVTSIAPHFIEAGMLDPADYWELKGILNSRKQGEEFLLRFLRWGARAYVVLIEALKKEKCQHIIDKLEECDYVDKEIQTDETTPNVAATGTCPHCKRPINPMPIYDDAVSTNSHETSAKTISTSEIEQKEDVPVNASGNKIRHKSSAQSKPETARAELSTSFGGDSVTDGKQINPPCEHFEGLTMETIADSFSSVNLSAKNRVYPCTPLFLESTVASSAGNPAFNQYNELLSSIEGWCPTVSESNLQGVLGDGQFGDGSYFIWYSQAKQCPCFTVWYGGTEKHYKIKERESGFGITSNRLFPSIEDVINDLKMNGIEMKPDSGVLY